MKKLLTLGLISLSLTAFADANSSAIDGYWQTVDDTTNNPKGIVQISTENNIVSAYVRGGYPINGVVPHQICTKCPSPFANQPVTNMRIMWDVSYNNDNQDYEGGQILDPDSGNIYRVIVTPIDNTQTLKVRGYIGIPLIGRTQLWHRLTAEQFKQLMAEYPQ